MTIHELLAALTSGAPSKVWWFVIVGMVLGIVDRGMIWLIPGALVGWVAALVWDILAKLTPESMWVLLGALKFSERWRRHWPWGRGGRLAGAF